MEEDIKEDIKIVKELQKEVVHLSPNESSYRKKQAQAIENILNGLEQDERVINKAIEFIENKIEYLKKCRTFKVVFYDEEYTKHEWDEALLYKENELLNILKGNQKEV